MAELDGLGWCCRGGPLREHAYVQWSVDEGSGDGRGSLMGTSRCRLSSAIFALLWRPPSARAFGTQWLELIVVALPIVMDSFDQTSRALEQQPLRRSVFQKKRRRVGQFEVVSINVMRRAHKEMERRCNAI